jgi:hypothetical protein
MLLLQALLVYAIPAAVLRGSAWWKALWQSVQETARHPVSTLVVVSLFSLPLVLFSGAVSMDHLAKWMTATTPEIALVAVTMRLLVWMVSDGLMTVGAAHLWLLRKEGPAVV